MMFLHEQNETELILTAENLWPLSTFFKSLLFPCLRQGNNFAGNVCEEQMALLTKQGGFAMSPRSRRAKLVARGVLTVRPRVCEVQRNAEVGLSTSFH
jgi:hypothetical protein